MSIIIDFMICKLESDLLIEKAGSLNLNDGNIEKPFKLIAESKIKEMERQLDILNKNKNNDKYGCLTTFIVDKIV